MKRFLILFLMLILTTGVFVGLSYADESTTNVVTDCAGARVEVPNEIDKVVVTSPSAVAFMIAMNLGDKLVGTHGAILNQTWAYLFYEDFYGMPMFGKKPNAEELIAADVDLVIIKDAAYAEELRKTGITAVCFKYSNKEELYAALDMLGNIFGEEAKSYVSSWKDKLETTISSISADLADIPEDQRHNVYYIDATGAEATNESLFLTAGGGSFVEYWIKTSGGNLVTSPYEGLEQIDQETALTLNPDTIFICGWLEYFAKDVLMNDPLWQDVPAVKNGNVYIMPTSFVSYDRFAVELPLMLDYTAKMMYPEQHAFGGIEELREFYEKYYGLSFSDDQLENMLKGLNPDGTRMGESEDQTENWVNSLNLDGSKWGNK